MLTCSNEETFTHLNTVYNSKKCASSGEDGNHRIVNISLKKKKTLQRLKMSIENLETLGMGDKVDYYS